MVAASLAAIGPDGSVAYYLALGMVAAVNPCGFAMLPAYLSYFLGEDPHGRTSTSGTASARPRERDGSSVADIGRGVRVALAVSAGFLAVFALAGTAVELSSLPVYEYMPWASILIGVALVALGIAMIAGFSPALRLPKLERGGRSRTLPSMFVFGVSYAIASIGCTLPTFLVAVAGTIDRESVVDGLVVFAVYATGMAVVLTALTVATALAQTSVVRLVRSVQPYLDTVAGVLVALAGVYVAYYGALELRTYRARGGQVPSSGITDVVTGWSYDVTEWIQRTGSVRIAMVVVLLLAALALGTQAIRLHRSSAPAPETGAPTPKTAETETGASAKGAPVS
jgi:cytochrome c-type biogenesis protein